MAWYQSMACLHQAGSEPGVADSQTECVNETYTSQQFDLIQSRLGVMWSALDHFQRHKTLFPEYRRIHVSQQNSNRI